jgi:hypothetical protein
MKYEKISTFPTKAEAIQYNLVKRVLSPLILLQSKISSLITELKFFQYCLKFGQRDDDIYICTYLKSGTTLMQMIVYQLTTEGSMDFDHIYDVSPWIRNDAHRGRSPLYLPSPRVIKSHDYYGDFEKGTKGRFIHVVRDGKDVAVSLFHQNKNYINPDLEFGTVFKSFFTKKGKMNWFQFNEKWFENKNRFKILHLRYEDLIDDKESQIRKIAAFLGIAVTPEILSRTLERSSFEFMKQHEDKFGEQPVERVYNQFIRKGKKGEGEEFLTEEQKEFYNIQFSKHLTKYLSK